MLEKRYTIEELQAQTHLQQDGPDFIVPMPPPNLTGVLHIGHALGFTVQDIILRQKYLQGFNPVWLAGTDHSGISGQLMFEKFLLAQKIQLNQSDKLQHMEVWRTEKANAIRQQSESMFFCADWDKARYTLDQNFSKAVIETFVKLFNNKLIYRAKRLVRWDIKLQTAISDLEVYSRSVKGKMYYISYKGVDCDGVTIATTRPETIFADAAIAVNPADARYKDLIGKKVKVPLTERVVNIIADARVKIDFGTGALKITPAHDDLDWEIGKDHNLEIIEIIDKAGLMISGPLQGMTREDAREQIISMLECEKIEEIEHIVPYGDRSHTVIEILPTLQWFCDMTDIAKNALDNLDRIDFIPENRLKVMKDYLENIQPWCVSRQLWWGHRVPIWTDKNGNYICAHSEQEAYEQSGANPGELTQDPDVLDTWFSSAIWTVVTDKPLTDLLVTGYDILNAWVARMIMMSVYLTGNIPFKQVLLTGLVRDKKGAKMSKTLGNVIDPLELVKKFGADAVRLWLVDRFLPGSDIPLDPNAIQPKQEFMTKIWNVSRFCLMKGVTLDLPNTIHESWNCRWVNRLREMQEEIENSYQSYRYADLNNILYHGFWEEFANQYLEGAKAIWSEETAAVVGFSLIAFLRWLNPIIPGITRKLHECLGCNDIVWPAKIPQCADALDVKDWIAFGTKIRQISKMVKVTEFTVDFTGNLEILKCLTRCSITLRKDLDHMIDLGYGKLSCKVEEPEGVGRIYQKLNNELMQLTQNQNVFNDSTPQEVVMKNQNKCDELQMQMKYLEQLLDKVAF